MSNKLKLFGIFTLVIVSILAIYHLSSLNRGSGEARPPELSKILIVADELQSYASRHERRLPEDLLKLSTSRIDGNSLARYYYRPDGFVVDSDGIKLVLLTKWTFQKKDGGTYRYGFWMSRDNEFNRVDKISEEEVRPFLEK